MSAARSLPYRRDISLKGRGGQAVPRFQTRPRLPCRSSPTALPALSPRLPGDHSLYLALLLACRHLELGLWFRWRPGGTSSGSARRRAAQSRHKRQRGRCLFLPNALRARRGAISFDIARGAGRRARASRAVVSADTHRNSSSSNPLPSLDLPPGSTEAGPARLRRYMPRNDTKTATKGLQTQAILISTSDPRRGHTGHTP